MKSLNIFITIASVVFIISGIQAQQQQKKTIAVLEFNSDDLSKKELNILTNRFRSILVKTQSFDVLERDKMADILKEQDFTMSDQCNSAECAVQVGRLLGMELMVAGDVGLLGSTYSIDLRLIDVTTGKIIQTETQDYEGKIDGLLGAMTTIANTFAGVKSSVSDNQKSTALAQSSSDTFTDPRDGKVYKTVKIGNQVWMAENLNYDAGKGSWCYDNNSSNCDKYGRLYDWETAKRVAPPGWHLPSKNEFKTLLKNLGVDSTNIYEQIILNGSSGFNALFGGSRSHNDSYNNVGSGAGFSSATERGSDRMWCLHVTRGDQRARLNSFTRTGALSVRLVMDTEDNKSINKNDDRKIHNNSNNNESDNSFTDPRDGKVYKTVKIGNQVWMAENLKYDAGKGSWCYGNISSNCDIYGKLYDWETAKRVAPPGWHLPSKEEIMTLIRTLTDEENAYKQIIPGGSSGFNALFGGLRDNEGDSYGIGREAVFWSSTEGDDVYGTGLCVNNIQQRAHVYFNYKNYAFNVRLLKD